MTQGFRFGGFYQGHELFAFEGNAIIKFFRYGSGHGFHALQRRWIIFGHDFDRIACELQVAIRIGMLNLQITHFR